MNEKVLFVDDEPNVLAAFRRQLRGRFALETATSSRKALEMIKDQGPYAVVVSDLRMPGMDGIGFLTEVRKVNPDTVRIILTGHADLEKAIEAVNEGKVFQFLTKPCHPDRLIRSISAGLDQYRLVTAKRVLLERTLKGVIRLLMDLLSTMNPEAFGRSSRIKRLAGLVARQMGVRELWKIETAAMLSQVGCVILPEEALQKLYRGEKLTGEEGQLYDMHPMIASDLIANIPRMEEIAEIVRYQLVPYSGPNGLQEAKKGNAIPLGARILKVVVDYDLLESGGRSKEDAISLMEQREGWYDPLVLAALKGALGVSSRFVLKSVRVQDLQPGMILADEIRSQRGQLLVSKGQELNSILIQRLRNFSKSYGIVEPIPVVIPKKNKQERDAPAPSASSAL